MRVGKEDSSVLICVMLGPLSPALLMLVTAAAARVPWCCALKLKNTHALAAPPVIMLMSSFIRSGSVSL
jgi:hypothetical protein